MNTTLQQTLTRFRQILLWCAILCLALRGVSFILELGAVGGATPKEAATFFIRGMVKDHLPDVNSDDIQWIITDSDAPGDAAKRVELEGYIGPKRIAFGAVQRFMNFGWKLIYIGLDDEA